MEHITDPTESKRIIKSDEQLYAHKSYNLDKSKQFFKRRSPPKLTLEGKHGLGWPIFIKEIESVIKHLTK